MPRDRFLLIGHSFVRKVRDACYSDEAEYASFQPNLGLRDGMVMMIGDFGPQKPLISHVHDVERWIRENPRILRVTDVTQIDIGSNDLLQSCYCDAPGLAKKVYQLAKNCIDMGSKRVVIRQVLWFIINRCLLKCKLYFRSFKNPSLIRPFKF